MEALVKAVLGALVIGGILVISTLLFRGTPDMRCWWNEAHCPGATAQVTGDDPIAKARADQAKAIKDAQAAQDAAYAQQTVVAIKATTAAINTSAVQPTPAPSNGQSGSNTGAASSGGGASQVYTFQWVSGDLYGEPNACHIMISEPNGSIQIPPSHGVTSGLHTFNAASKKVYDDQVANIQANANNTGPCDIVSQPKSFPFS